jgi:hypothetical protein
MTPEEQYQKFGKEVYWGDRRRSKFPLTRDAIHITAGLVLAFAIVSIVFSVVMLVAKHI